MLNGYRLLPRFVRVLSFVLAVCVSPFGSGIYSAAETPDAIFDSLYKDIIPATGRPRPPYLLARYDPGLDTSKTDELLPQPEVDDEGVFYVPEFEFYEGFLDETDWPRAKGVLNAFRAQAVARQERLEGRYALLKPGGQLEALARLSPQRAAQVSLIQYAFGDGSLADARTAAGASGAESQFSFAEYLAAEASFVDAVEELNVIAGTISLEALEKALSIAIGPLDHSPRSVAELTPSDTAAVRALGLLARLKVDATAADGIRVIGEYYAFYDAEKDDAATKSVSAYIRIIEQSYKPYTGFQHNNADIEGIIGDDIFDPGCGVILEGEKSAVYPIYLYPSSMLLQMNCPEFSAQFSDKNSDWQDGGIWTGDSIKLDIFSEYHGTIRIDVHRFDTETDWKKATLADQQTLANAEIETMTVNAGDICDNNRKPAHRETVSLSTRKPGYYFAVVTAPLAPVARAFKFAVSRQSLYLRTTRNGVFVRAYQRGDGQPVAGADVRLEIAATLPPDDAIIAYKPKNPSAFRAGWLASDDEISSFEGIAIGPDEDPLVSAASALTDWQTGRAAREKFFQEPAVRRITTDDDGCVFVPLAFDAKDTTYRIRAWLPNEGYGEATITKYQPKNPSIGANRQAAIWSDRPIYRPGETARIKGVLRDNDMFELRVPVLNAENKVYLVVMGADGILFRGERPLSDSGSFHLDVDIPHLYRSGGCSVLVLKENKLDRMIKGEGEYPGAVYFPFEINEFRLPALIINEPECLNMIYGGSDLTGSIGIKNLIGGAVEGLDVELRFQGKSVSKYTDADGRVEFSFPTDAVFSEQSSNFDIQVIDSAGVSHSRQKTITILHQPFRLDVETKGISEYYGNNVYAGRAYSVT
ncbi:MAG: MG2 domain-containing protein, partial [Planctomycetota bacterium]